MEEKCLVAASLTVLLCHPRSTIRCFSPKSRTMSPQKVERPILTDSHTKKLSPRSKKKQRSSRTRSKDINLLSNHPPSATMRMGKLSNAVVELTKDDTSFATLEKIFLSRWSHGVAVTIYKVLKVNHTAEVIYRFEEFREMVKSKSARSIDGEKMGRLVTDGNELLRFHGTTVACSLGVNGISDICTKENCGVCRVISSRFSDGQGPITFYETTWRAHEKAANEHSMGQSRSRTAIVFCRAIAGRVARYHRHGVVNNKAGHFDSVACLSGDQPNSQDELVLFNRRAFLPCFVVIYNNVKSYI